MCENEAEGNRQLGDTVVQPCLPFIASTLQCPGDPPAKPKSPENTGEAPSQVPNRYHNDVPNLPGTNPLQFNHLAGPLGAEPLTLNQAREFFRRIADANVEPRINLARLEMLRTFGTVDEQLSAVQAILGEPSTGDFLSKAIPDSMGKVQD